MDAFLLPVLMTVEGSEISGLQKHIYHRQNIAHNSGFLWVMSVV